MSGRAFVGAQLSGTAINSVELNCVIFPHFLWMFKGFPALKFKKNMDYVILYSGRRKNYLHKLHYENDRPDLDNEDIGK